MRRFALAVIACALLGACAAAPAGAHTGSQDGTSCAAITLDLAGFPPGENTVTTSIAIDGVPIEPVVSTFQGPDATIVVPLPPFRGTRRVAYQTSWSVGGGGQTEPAVVTITCGKRAGHHRKGHAKHRKHRCRR